MKETRLILDARDTDKTILNFIDPLLEFEDLVMAAAVRDVLERNRVERNDRDGL